MRDIDRRNKSKKEKCEGKEKDTMTYMLRYMRLYKSVFLLSFKLTRISLLPSTAASAAGGRRLGGRTERRRHKL